MSRDLSIFEQESCYKESIDISKSISNLINLIVDRSKGMAVDEDIDSEVNNLTINEIRFKKCIIRQANRI